MREKELEHKLFNTVKEMGGLALKFVSPGMDGMPDRIVLLPGGKIGFVEVKRQGLKYRPLQLRRAEQLRELGFKMFLLDRVEQIGDVIREIQST